MARVRGAWCQGLAVAVGALMVLVLLGSVVSWTVTGSRIVARELRVYEGLLWRRTRAIPLERLQSVELVQPLLARAFGLAELRLEVVGAAKTEAPLAFLTVAQATDLRRRLLAVAGRPHTAEAGVPHQAEPATAGRAIERVIHTVSNAHLVGAQLLRPQWWFIPLAVAVPIVFFARDNDLGFIAIASTLTAVLGTILAPVRAVLGEWGFTVATAHDGLRIRRGLTERRSQTVPAGRIRTMSQSRWPLLGGCWAGYACPCRWPGSAGSRSPVVRCCRSGLCRRRAHRRRGGGGLRPYHGRRVPRTEPGTLAGPTAPAGARLSAHAGVLRHARWPCRAATHHRAVRADPRVCESGRGPSNAFSASRACTSTRPAVDRCRGGAPRRRRGEVARCGSGPTFTRGPRPRLRTRATRRTPSSPSRHSGWPMSYWGRIR